MKSSLRPDVHRTQVQLDTLPDGAVVVDRFGHAWQSGRVRDTASDSGFWYRAYDGDGISSFELAQRAQTVRILKGENKSTAEFCDECSGPHDGWLAERYGGHWDTCPNRIKGENK